MTSIVGDDDNLPKYSSLLRDLRPKMGQELVLVALRRLVIELARREHSRCRRAAGEGKATSAPTASPHSGSRVSHRRALPCDELLWQPLLKQHYLGRARWSKRTLQRFLAANACDPVKLWRDVCHGIASLRAIVMHEKTRRSVQFEIIKAMSGRRAYGLE